MHNKIKNFINKHSALIEDNAWDEIYKLAAKELDSLTGLLTDALLEVGINPLEYLNYIPEAFHFGGKATKIDIPEGITKIDLDAFGDSHITEINLPTSLRDIAQEAFSCSNFAEIDLRQPIKQIGTGAFDTCKHLVAVYLPATIVSIPQACFNNCINLSSVEIPEGIERIEKLAFWGCTNLDELLIPRSVTYIANKSLPDHTDVICYENSYAHEYCVAKDRHYILV